MHGPWEEVRRKLKAIFDMELEELELEELS